MCMLGMYLAVIVFFAASDIDATFESLFKQHNQKMVVLKKENEYSVYENLIISQRLPHFEAAFLLYSIPSAQSDL
jgi:hypothetical protein